MKNKLGSSSAKPSPNEKRGALHLEDQGHQEMSAPHIAVEAEPAEPQCITVHRVLRLKLERPDEKIWRLLREVAAECASYANHVIDAEWCAVRGFRPPLDKDPKGKPNNPSKELRRRFTGRLSGDVYVAIEREARAQWRKVMGRSLNGWQGTPRFGANRAISVRATDSTGRPSGVHFVERGRDSKGNSLYAIKVLLLKKGEGTPDDHRRVTLNIVGHSARDRYQGPTLSLFASGERKIDRLNLVFHPKRGAVIAHLSYKRKILTPAFGERVATLGPLDVKHDRLTVRIWHDGERIVAPRDYSRRLYHMRTMKKHFDKLSRRYRYSLGRAKGSRRLLRKKLAGSFGEWARQLNHRWSAEIISWLATQGVCRLDVFPISDLDWPSHELIEMLKDKGNIVGIEVVKISEKTAPAENEVTYKSALAALKREQRRAGKMREAVRTLEHHLA